MCRSPSAPPLATASSPTVTRPSEPTLDSEKLPLSRASKGSVGREAAATWAVAETVPAVVRAASSVDGVPALAAQPDLSGPVRAQTPISTGTTSAARPPASRTGPAPDLASTTRQSTASTKAATEPKARSSNQLERDRAEADPDRAVARDERDDGVAQADRRVAIEDRR